MEKLIEDLMEKLTSRRNDELKIIEKHRQNHLTDLILISSGKIIEIDEIIKDLEELLRYDLKMKHG